MEWYVNNRDTVAVKSVLAPKRTELWSCERDEQVLRLSPAIKVISSVGVCACLCPFYAVVALAVALLSAIPTRGEFFTLVCHRTSISCTCALLEGSSENKEKVDQGFLHVPAQMRSG